MSSWLTPEEMARKRETRKRIIYITIPIVGAIIGAIITILSNIM